MVHAQCTVLIVEDEGIVAHDLKILLTTRGYTVLGIAYSGEEAVRQVSMQKPDIVVMDIGLQGKIDGIEAARLLRQEWDIPVVFITANSDSGTLERAKITQPYGYILKPFDEREIHSTLEMAISRHRSDSQLIESRKWLATTLQSIGDAVIATDEIGCVKFMNPIAEKLTGWTQSEATGLPLPEIFKIINQASRITVPNPVELVLQDGHIVGLANHTILISRDGTEYNIDDSAAPIPDAKGSVIGVVLTFRDITEKYKIEAEIEKNERRFRAMIENNHDMIRLVDATGKLIYLSPSAERITGYSIEEFDGHLMLSITHPDDLPTVKEKIDELFANPSVPIEILYRIRHKAGHWLWMEGTVTNLLHDPAIGAIVSNIRDVTARKVTEEKLREKLCFAYSCH
ncbi:MAG: PAS domain S-box protein [Ignavibacteria bacterium]|nr:PAS domain S-box protein [Ignavibacteria bacterium]